MSHVHASKLYSFLKQLAGIRQILEIEEVRVHFPTSRPALYAALKQLEEEGLIERVFHHSGKQGRPPLIQVKLLRDAPETQPVSSEKPCQAEVLSVQPKSVAPSAPPPVQTKPLPAPVLSAPGPVAPASRTTQLGAVVLIDENQIIRSEEEGRVLDPQAVLEKVKVKLGQNVEKLYFYFSQATERRNRPMVERLLSLEHPLIRTIKTGSQSGTVDKRMKEDVDLWLRVDFISTIVLCTADGGSDFLAAIKEIKKCGKKFVLMKLGGYFNANLESLADSTIDASTVGPRVRPFEELIIAAKEGNIQCDDSNTRFLSVIAGSFEVFFRNNIAGAKFMEIIDYVRPLIRNRREFDGFTEQDLRAALTSLTQTGKVLSWKKDDSGRNIYSLPTSNTLLRTLGQVVPVSKRA